MPDSVADTMGGLDIVSAAGTHLSPTDTQGRTVAPEDREGSHDREVVVEAHERFERCQNWESTARARWLDDLKFANGDSLNQYQWPNSIRRERDVDERPCLTINKTRQHNLHIKNDAKKNKPAIKVRATGNGATVESAKVLNAIMRHIEYVSNAQVAYDTATSYQVDAGKGYLRLVTDWEDEESFNQVPFIRRVTDPLAIYMDPEAKEADKSDARFAFIFDNIPQDEFDKLYPQYKQYAAGQNIDDASGWTGMDSIRLAEYFRKVEHKDRLYMIPAQQGQGAGPQGGPGGPAVQGPGDGASAEPMIFRESDLEQDPSLLDRIKALPGVKSRETTREVVEWYLIIGSKVAESEVWPGRYIPIVPVIGEETVIQGEYDCKGHTRAMLDPQRMYNYMSSVAVEYSAVQTKSPWIAPAEAIEGYEVDWANANRINKSLLAYNGLNDEGKEIPPPQRVSPPVSMPAAIEGMQVALNEMMFASGQYQAEMGQQGNERSAKAIEERQRSAETSTYHFVDNLAIAIRCVGRQLLDLIPKLYSARMVLNILAEDGTSMEVQIDPGLQQAAKVTQVGDAQTIARVLFNPRVGKYDVQADVGPDWGTRRQETANALSILLTQAPQITPLIGDLLMSSYEFEGAQEAAARLRRMVPAQALGSGPSPEVQALMAQVQQLQAVAAKAMQELAQEKLKLKGKDALRDVDAHRAASERLKDLLHAATEQGIKVDEGTINALVADAAQQASGTPLAPIVEASAPTLEASALSGQMSLPLSGSPPIPGARMGRDGHWYVRNYANSGSWAIVE